MNLEYKRYVSVLYSPSQNTSPYWINKFYFERSDDVYGETVYIDVDLPQAVYAKRTKFNGTYYGDEWVSTSNSSEVYVEFKNIPSGDSFRLINRTGHTVYANAINSYIGALQPDTGYLVRVGGFGHNKVLETGGMIGNNLMVMADSPKNNDIFGLVGSQFKPGVEGLGKKLYISLTNTNLAVDEIIKIAVAVNKDFEIYVGHYDGSNVSNYIKTEIYHQVSVSNNSVVEYLDKYFAYTPSIIASQFRVYNGGIYESI